MSRNSCMHSTRPGPRILLFVFVALAHIAAYWLVKLDRLATVVWNAPVTAELVLLPLLDAAPVPEPETRQRSRRIKPVRTPVGSSASTKRATSPPQLDSATAAPHFDWIAEAQRAALEAADAESKPKPRSFDRRRAPDDRIKPRPEFAWSHARTHRVETSPNGVTAININDRCTIVLAFPIPLCNFGKKKGRGDLFDHMHDPAQLGDWKDKP